MWRSEFMVVTACRTLAATTSHQIAVNTPQNQAIGVRWCRKTVMQRAVQTERTTSTPAVHRNSISTGPGIKTATKDESTTPAVRPRRAVLGVSFAGSIGRLARV